MSVKEYLLHFTDIFHNLVVGGGELEGTVPKEPPQEVAVKLYGFLAKRSEKKVRSRLKKG